MRQTLRTLEVLEHAIDDGVVPEVATNTLLAGIYQQIRELMPANLDGWLVTEVWLDEHGEVQQTQTAPVVRVSHSGQVETFVFEGGCTDIYPVGVDSSTGSMVWHESMVVNGKSVTQELALVRATRNAKERFHRERRRRGSLPQSSGAKATA